MKLDGNAVLYQLRREFGHVTCNTPLKSIMVDYPLLYDSSMDMSGHVVLVPDHEHLEENDNMSNVLCVCIGEASARAAERGGLCVAQVHGDVLFQNLYNRMQATFVNNERLDAQLRAYVDTYAGYQPLLDACSRTMGFDCMLIDDQFRTVCRSSGPVGSFPSREDVFASETLDEEAVDMFMASQHYRRMREGRKVFTVPGADNLFMRNVFWKNHLVGALVMKHLGDAMSARYVRFLLNYLAPFVEDMYERVGTFNLTASRPTQIRAAFRSALGGIPEACNLLERLLLEEGHAHRNHYKILRIERSFTQEGTEGLGYFAQRFERAWPQAYCVEHDGMLFALVDIEAPVEDPTIEGRFPRAYLGELPGVLRDNLAKAGASRPFFDMHDIPAACIQAETALDQGKQVDPEYWYYRFEDYVLAWLIGQSCGTVPSEYVCHPAIAKLAHYDDVHESELLPSLKVFMECRYNATLAAQELFVARSTLINRLERVVELTGIDLDDLDERLYVAISFKLMKL